MSARTLQRIQRQLVEEQSSRRTAEQRLEYEKAKSRLMARLSRCLGKNKALSMPQAFEAAYPDRSWRHRINDTRAVRDIIEDLQWGDPEKGVPPVPIASSTSHDRPGYYIPVGQELEEWLQGKEKKSLKGLKLVSLHRRLTLPEELGQLALKMRGGEEAP